MKRPRTFSASPPSRLVEPALEKCEVRLVTAVEISCDEVGLAAEVVVERALRDASLLGNSVHAYATDTLTVKQLACGGDYALLRWDRVPTSEYTNCLAARM